MDWILGEVLESLENEIKSLSLRIDQYSTYEDTFKSAVATDDKFEAGRHEYWRGRYLEAIENYERIKDMVDDIYEMIDEEAKRDKEYRKENCQRQRKTHKQQ